MPRVNKAVFRTYYICGVAMGGNKALAITVKALFYDWKSAHSFLKKFSFIMKSTNTEKDLIVLLGVFVDSICSNELRLEGKIYAG